MNDDKIRELLQQAHGDDRPPPFVVPQKRRRFPAIVLLAPALALLVFVLSRHHKPALPDLALPQVHYPTDFLLPQPGLEVPEPTKGLLQ